MTGNLRRRRLVGLCTAALLVTAFPAWASIRVVSDAVLAASSAVAVHGKVVALEARWDPTVETIYTYVTLEVWRSWGRTDFPARIVLKQLGGRIAETELRVGGQASFTIDEEVFVFLEVRPRDRTLYVAGLEQGKWAVAEFTSAGAPAALREAHAALFQLPIEPEHRALADLEQLAEASGGTDTSALVAVPTEFNQPHASAPAWAYLIPDAPARWHEADSGQPVYVDSHAGGHPQFQGGGVPQLTRAIAMWRNASSLEAQLGISRGPRCFTNNENDGRISVTYGDPCGEIADASGTLAIGGFYWTGGNGRAVNGVTFRKIDKGMVVIDNASSKFQKMSVGCYEQMLVHELGHAIGFGHSSVPSAIMYPTLWGCGARTMSNPLSSDERAGLSAIYPTSPNAPPLPAPSAPPSGLVAAVAGSTVTLQWIPSAGAVQGYLVEAGSASGLANLAAVTVAGPSLTVPNVSPGVYYVRVRAIGSAGGSAPSNEVQVLVAVAGLPGAPSGLSAVVSASNVVTLVWNAPAGAALIGYVLEAGSGPGLANLAIAPLPPIPSFVTAGVPAGTYYVRVRGVSVAGPGPASSDIVVTVP